MAKKKEKEVQLPQNIDELLPAFHSVLNTRIKAAWLKERAFVDKHSPDGAKHLPALRDVLPKRDLKETEVILPVAGAVSAGKSSLLNALCQYPIVPVAPQTTSICAIEIRRAKSEAEEKLEVCLLTKDKSALCKKPVKVFNKQKFGVGIFRGLVDYALSLSEKSLLSITDTLDYFRDSQGKIAFNPDNWRHNMVLLMILLDTYIQQDKQDVAVIYQQVNEDRNKLMEALGVPIDTDYGLKLYWNSEFIPEETAIVDLPGTGSATKNTDKQIGHTGLVSNYISKAPSLLFLIGQTGLIDSESQSVLDTFLMAEKIRTGKSSARLTFVMNKADIAKNSQEVQTSINSFRQNYIDHYPSYSEYPVYAISARCSEWLFVKSAVAVENTYAARELSEAFDPLGMTPSNDMISKLLEEKFLRRYPYQITNDGDFDEMRLQDFFQKFFVECSERIRILNTVRYFQEHLEVIETFRTIIAQEFTMLDLARKFGGKCATALSETIIRVMNESIAKMNTEINQLQEGINNQIANIVENLKKVSNQFMADYNCLNQKINSQLRVVIAGMEKDWVGNIPIGGNILGGNKKGLNNQKKLSDFAKKISTYDFISEFKKGFDMLEGEVLSERSFYRESIDKISLIFEDFPDKVIEKMRAEFKSLSETEEFSGIDSFDAAVEDSIKTTEELLRRVCDNMVLALRQDSSVEKVIEQTINVVQKDFMGLLSPYKAENFEYRMKTAFIKSRRVRTDVIEPNALNEFLSEYYLDNFKSNLMDMFDKVFKGKRNIKDSHHIRMQIAIKLVIDTYLSSETLDKLNQQVQKACDVTAINFNDETLLGDWTSVLQSSAEELRSFFDEDSIGVYICEQHDALSTIDWLCSVLDYAAESTETIKAKVFDLHIV